MPAETAKKQAPSRVEAGRVHALGQARSYRDTHAYREKTVTSWYDWRMALAWLMVVAIAAGFYFFPIARLVDSLGD